MRRPWLLCLLLPLALSLATAVEAAPPKLLVVVLDRVSWPDLAAHETQAPTVWELARTGAVAAMCVRAAGSESGAYLTLGAGSRALSGGSGYLPGGMEAQAFNTDESVTTGTAPAVPAAKLYQARALRSPGADRVLHLGFGEAAWQNRNPSYPLALGLLGDGLRQAGLHVACLGNADTARGMHREIAAAAMDSEGRVELGDVGADLLSRDVTLPWEYQTDLGRLQQAFVQAAARADVVLVDLGETSRFDQYLEAMPPGRADERFGWALARADRSLAALLRVAPPSRWAILLLSPTLPSDYPNRPAASLAPVIWHSPEAQAGFLQSPSTRRPGIVANTDIAATILTYFRVPAPAVMVGRPLQVVPASSAAGALEQRLARYESVEGARRAMFRGFPTFAAILLWVCVGCFLLGERVPQWMRTALRGLLLLCLAIPAGSLLFAVWPDHLTAAGTVVGALLLSAVLALGASLATRGRHADALLAGVVAGLPLLDLLTGQHMLQWSTLSYSASAGARFYGIGNEFAGAVLGALLAAFAAFLSRRSRLRLTHRVGVTAALVLATALIAFPRLGANFGMALSCAVGFTVFGVYLWRGRFRWVDALLMLVAIVCVAALIVGADAVLSRRGGSSHIGLLVDTMRAQGLSALADVAARKLAMSWMLMRVSVWTGLALGAAALLLTAIYSRPVRMLEGLRRRRWLLPALISIVAGSAASLALNDSGILAAALALLYGAGSLAYLGLGKMDRARRRMHVVSVEPRRPLRTD